MCLNFAFCLLAYTMSFTIFMFIFFLSQSCQLVWPVTTFTVHTHFSVAPLTIYESHAFVWVQDNWHPCIQCITVFSFWFTSTDLLHFAREFQSTYILECIFLCSCHCHGSVCGNTITMPWLPLLVDSERKFLN